MAHYHRSDDAWWPSCIFKSWKGFWTHHMQKTFIFVILSISFSPGKSEWEVHSSHPIGRNDVNLQVCLLLKLPLFSPRKSKSLGHSWFSHLKEYVRYSSLLMETMKQEKPEMQSERSEDWELTRPFVISAWDFCVQFSALYTNKCFPSADQEPHGH